MSTGRRALWLLGFASLCADGAELPGPVAWSAGEGLSGASVRVPSEGDGTVAIADVAGRKAVRNTGASPYVYVDLPEGFAPAKAWVTVDYLDEGFGHIVLEYDSRQDPGAPLLASYRRADAAHGTLRLGTGAWRRAVFELAEPGLRNRENYHSDFRLSPRVAVASIRISGAPPPDAELAAVRAAGDLGRRPPLVTVGPGVESTVGGLDQFDTSRSAVWKEQLLRELPVQKYLGATSHETYVTWAACQPKPDAWDFAHYDACVEAHRQAGLKWVPFVILGPAYTLPDWYRDSMNRWIELWMRTATREMPRAPVYLCTGGHAPPEHGSEFGVQSKLAAKHKGGVRITNEGSDYPANFAVTRWVASACRFYGTFFGFEPAGGVDEKGIVARVFNATASGAKQLHHYPDNILGNPKAVDKWKQVGGLMKLRVPKIDVALWYPNRMVDLRRGDVWRLLREMREVCDYDIVDDCLIRDGALDRYRILVCVSGGPYEADVLNRVRGWIRPDRMLFLPEGEGLAVAAVEGDAQAAAGWTAMEGGKALPAGGAGLDAYWPALRERLAGEGILVTGTRGIYGTVFQDGSTLLLNMTDAPGQVTVKEKAVAVPPAAIVEVP